MKKIKVFETFAGIGAQNKALQNIFNNLSKQNLINDNSIFKNKKFEIIGTSEWYIDGIISYDAIHHGTQETFKDFDKLDLNDMLEFIKEYSLSKDSKTLYEFEKIKKLKYEKIRQIYIALIRNKNYGSIVDIKGKNLPNIDILTYSFPCQNLSTIGDGKGIKKGGNTRSGLLWEIERILLELKELNKLPKFLLMENVKALLQKKHLEDWLSFEQILQELGYKNTTLVLNSKDFGIPQSRERVFVVSELNGITNINIDKTGEYTKGVGEYLDWDNIENQNEYKLSIPNNTPSRIKMWTKGKQIKKETQYFQTITTKQDRYPNCGNIYFPNDEIHIDKNGNKLKKSQFRFITPRESLLLMGFTNEDYERLKKIGMNKEEILKQAGNSIVVNVLESLFYQMIKRF
jgi:DNA (cytosine-5)-methyltransferase 1